MDDLATADMRLLIDRMANDAVRRHIEAAIQKIESGKTVESIREFHNGECRLPLDILARSGEFLAGVKHQRTLASLNITSRAVQEYTKAILYDTVILISDEEYEDFQFLHVSEKTITEGLQALADKALESDPDFPDLDDSNAFPKILFPRLIASMVRKEKVRDEYDVAVTVYAPIAPDSLLEMCSISEDFRSTSILGSIYRDNMSGEDDEEEGTYVPADGDPEVIADTVRELRFAETGRFLSLDELSERTHWVFPWWYDMDAEAVLRLDLRNLRVEVDENKLKEGARCTDILNALWFLFPMHDDQEHVFELEVAVAEWKMIGLIIHHHSVLLKCWKTAFRFELEKTVEREAVKQHCCKFANLLTAIWDDVSRDYPSIDLPFIQIQGNVNPLSHCRNPPKDLQMRFSCTMNTLPTLPEGKKGFRMSIEYHAKEFWVVEEEDLGLGLWFCKTSPRRELMQIAGFGRRP